VFMVSYQLPLRKEIRTQLHPHNPLTSVHPQMVDFGSGQGLSDFETAGIVGYSEDFRRAKTPPWAERCRLWMDTNKLIRGH